MLPLCIILIITLTALEQLVDKKNMKNMHACFSCFFLSTSCSKAVSWFYYKHTMLTLIFYNPF